MEEDQQPLRTASTHACGTAKQLARKT